MAASSCVLRAESIAALRARVADLDMQDRSTPIAASWQSLAPETLLEVCAFLDDKALGRLEIVGRIEGIARVWKAKADGIARGSLGPMSPKRMVATHARLHLLFPIRAMRVRSPKINFDEFAFSVIISYTGVGGTFRVSPFEYMRLISNRNEMGILRGIGQFAMLPSADASGLDISETLVELEDSDYDIPAFADEHNWSALLICTRKSDGTSIRVANFDQIDDRSAEMADPDEGRSCIWFMFGELFCRGATDALDFYLVLGMYFDTLTGRVAGFVPCVNYGSPEMSGSYMDAEIFHALLRSRLQDAASST